MNYSSISNTPKLPAYVAAPDSRKLALAKGIESSSSLLSPLPKKKVVLAKKGLPLPPSASTNFLYSSLK